MHTNSNVDPQSPTPSGSVSPQIPPLQRGKACLSCRRRKMRCDGARPVCTPCLRGERAEDCEYTDGQRRPRTLALEEDVARLRARLHELENPTEAVPSVELHPPYAAPGSSTTRSPGMGHVAVSASYFPAGSTGQIQTYPHQSNPLRADLEAEIHSKRALSVIAPYAAELGFFLNFDRLRVQGTHVLPALQSALTLWSAHIASVSEPGNAQSLERTQTLTSHFLCQAQTQLASALSTVDAEPDPAVILHLIQTGVLLAYYMQRIGQVVGARYYASGSWTLGMMLKLHQSPRLMGSASEGERHSSHGSRARDVPTLGRMSICGFAFADCAKLARALDEIEAEERVRAFWAVYALDRWFSTVGQWPSQSPVTDGNALTVPWPDAGSMREDRNVAQHLLSDPNHDFTQDGIPAMHAKASVLLGEATAVAASYVADHAITQSSTFQTRFGTLDMLLRRCLNTAMTVVTGSQSHTPEQAQALVTVHLIAFAVTTLHRPFISTHAPSQKRCAEAAFGVVRVLDRIGEAGIGMWSLGPIYATVWTALCLTLHEEVLRLRARPNADPSRRCEGEIVGVIRRLVAMLSALSQHRPSRFFAIKIEAVLPILQSIAT